MTSERMITDRTFFSLFRPSQVGGHEPKLFWANVPTTILQSIRHVASQRRWVRAKKSQIRSMSNAVTTGRQTCTKTATKSRTCSAVMAKGNFGAPTQVFSHHHEFVKMVGRWHTRYEVMLVFFFPLTCGHVGK